MLCEEHLITTSVPFITNFLAEILLQSFLMSTELLITFPLISEIAKRPFDFFPLMYPTPLKVRMYHYTISLF